LAERRNVLGVVTVQEDGNFVEGLENAIMVFFEDLQLDDLPGLAF